MQEVIEVARDALHSFVRWIFTPVAIYGALGGVLGTVRNREKGWKAISFGLLGGVTMSNILGPVIGEYAPLAWHYTLFFLSGFGGLELAGRLYAFIGNAFLKRVARKINPEDEQDGEIPQEQNTAWDGIERRAGNKPELTDEDEQDV